MAPGLQAHPSTRLIARPSARPGRDAGALSHKPGALVISLDFELQWGVRDHIPLSRPERTRLLLARAGIPRMLDLFEEFSVHATWATVGLLFAHCKEEAEAFMPAIRPSYADPRLDPYREPLGDSEGDDPFHFAPTLIDMIAARPGQEIASHSFSHFYCMETGQTAADFEADLNSAVAIAANSGYTLRSYVFPRNQVHPGYLSCLKNAGIRAYRGNEPVNAKRSAAVAEQRLPHWRIRRLLDSYMDIYGVQTIAWPNSLQPVSIGASRYLRPYHPAFAPFEALLLRRIEKALKYAAECGEIFHLWWHPEDFATGYDRNLSVLRRVLQMFAACRAQHGMLSLSMSEVTDATADGISPVQ